MEDRIWWRSTTALEAYQQAKQHDAEALVLFRVGDFYELFHEDAMVGVRVLGLTLTTRGRGESAVPMAGFPYHYLDSYLVKLVAAGHRVAVCEQVT